MRRTIILPLRATLLLLAVVAAACGDTTATEAATDSPASAETAGDIAAAPAAAPTPVDQSTLPEELQGTLTSITEEEINLADFRGDDVVLWFWAPW